MFFVFGFTALQCGWTEWWLFGFRRGFTDILVSGKRRDKCQKNVNCVKRRHCMRHDVQVTAFAWIKLLSFSTATATAAVSTAIA